jgi:hypothetical protein
MGWNRHNSQKKVKAPIEIIKKKWRQFGECKIIEKLGYRSRRKI